MLRWILVLVVCLEVGALAKNSHESGAGFKPGSKATSCPCGMSKKGRVVGGSKALPNEYPWMVMLVEGDSRDALCGASIVNPSVVITAAHCVHGSPKNKKFNILAGSSDANRPGQVVPVSSWIIHEKYYSPDYDIWGTVNDIALLKLARPLQFNANVGPVCMPTGKYSLKNKWLKLIGWGQLGGFLPSTRNLMETDIRALPSRTCQKAFHLKAPQTQICIQSPGKGACMGDSGGPVTYLDPETNRYTLVGLVSFGSSLCDSTDPTATTNVAAYLPWIKSKINSLGCHKVSRRRWSNSRDVVLGG